MDALKSGLCSSNLLQRTDSIYSMFSLCTVVCFPVERSRRLDASARSPSKSAGAGRSRVEFLRHSPAAHSPRIGIEAMYIQQRADRYQVSKFMHSYKPQEIYFMVCYRANRLHGTCVWLKAEPAQDEESEDCYVAMVLTDSQHPVPVVQELLELQHGQVLDAVDAVDEVKSAIKERKASLKGVEGRRRRSRLKEGVHKCEDREIGSVARNQHDKRQGMHNICVPLCRARRAESAQTIAIR